MHNSKSSGGLVPDSSKTPLSSDPWIYRMVTGALSLTVVVCVVGSILLQANEKGTPELLTGLGTLSFGTLAGLLVPSPTRQ